MVEEIKKRAKNIKNSLFPGFEITEESEKLVLQGRKPILLVQGYMMERESMAKIDRDLKDAGFAPISFRLRRFGFGSSVEELSEILKEKVEAFFKRYMGGNGIRKRIAAIGFSLGGVCLHWIVRALGGSSFVDRLITIASPINGLKYTIIFLPFKNFKPLRIPYDLWEGSEFIRKLKKRPFPPSTYFISIHSKDDIIAPQNACQLPDLPNTKNITFKKLFHSDLPFSEKITDEIISFLINTEETSSLL